MKLTRKQKDRIIMVLKKAKPFVADGYLVCGSAMKTNCDLADVNFVRDWIMNLIRPQTHVTDWLYIQHGVWLDKPQAVEYRLAWIDHMINELSKEEK